MVGEPGVVVVVVVSSATAVTVLSVLVVAVVAVVAAEVVAPPPFSALVVCCFWSTPTFMVGWGEKKYGLVVVPAGRVVKLIISWAVGGIALSVLRADFHKSPSYPYCPTFQHAGLLYAILSRQPSNLGGV